MIQQEHSLKSPLLWILLCVPWASTWAAEEVDKASPSSALAAQLVPVISSEGRQVLMVDGQRFFVRERVTLPFELKEGLQFSPDGRYAYGGSADGRVVKLDLETMTVQATVRVGLGPQSVRVSGDGGWLMVASTQPPALNLLDANLRLAKTFDLLAVDGKQRSQISSIHDAPVRKSFFVTLEDAPEIWEISYDLKAGPIYEGLVHDYRMGEAIPKPGFLGVKRSILDVPLQDYYVFRDGRHALGVTRPQGDMSSTLHVINLDIRRRVAVLALPGEPGLGAAYSFVRNGIAMLAIPDRKSGMVSVLDAKSWTLVQTVDTTGRHVLLRGHEHSAHIWVGSRRIAEGGTGLSLIDKRSLEAVAPGPSSSNPLNSIDFSADGRFAVISFSDATLPLLVYDTKTVTELAGVPVVKAEGRLR